MCVDGREKCCDHLKTSLFTLNGCKEIWVCCFCGKERDIIIEASVRMSPQKGHGCFAPETPVFGSTNV